MRANIKGAGTDVIRIRGVEPSSYGVFDHSDQIEAGTFMFLLRLLVVMLLFVMLFLSILGLLLSREIGCEVEGLMMRFVSVRRMCFIVRM